MPAEERLVFQNGLHDLQTRKNRANLVGDQAEVKAIDTQIQRADPIFRRLQADITQAESMGLQLPAVQAARSAANRATSRNNLKQLALAMHNHESVYNYLPRFAIFSKEGKPLLSWRVALLPYLEQTLLYRKFKLDEPWDSPHNKALLKYMPMVYIPPEDAPSSEPYTTHYQVFVGVGGRIGPLFEPNARFQVRMGGGCPDGNSGTLLMVEAATAVPWTKPEDLAFNPEEPPPRIGGLYKDGIAAAFADGSVRFLTRDLDDETILALITRNGGEPIEWTKLR
jgi:hypothetical protein